MPTTGEYEPELVVDDARNGGKPMYLSDDGYGTKIAWDTCHRFSGGCGNVLTACTCKGGPVEPGYIARWRDEAKGIVKAASEYVKTAVRSTPIGRAPGTKTPAKSLSMASFIDAEVIAKVKAASETPEDQR